MEVYFMILLFLSSLISTSVAVDIITANQSIKDGKTIVSHGEMYKLGFFSPGNSKKRYVGIWYKKISRGTVVWVANRDTPVADTSAMLKVSKEGNMLISGGGNTVIWSTGLAVSARNNNTVVQLLDNGNLVMWYKNSTNTRLIWQSFDYPSDTMLPGMNIRKDLVTGLQRSLTSWKSPDDPSPGMYSNIVDTNGYPQIFKWKGEALESRHGPWNGLAFSGFASEIPNPVYTAEFVINEKEIYHKYELIGSVVQRVVLTSDGKTLLLHWIERIQEWIIYGLVSVDSCGRFELFGSYGICSINKHPPCSCIEGFEPKFPEEWKASDWSSGCKRKKPLGLKKFRE
ncbi:hypothetical protein L1987_15813 [Smallanthus sonchifolius]|uniref:Uncharacterized protein n=1 Tax=Smallanthus sonchifolius TaxID=185202 RepID=A0ACB9J8W5_9ASTR|nr:hypothetical protein L1987_15813 [Smallanthus sonchifolius]